MPNFATDFGEEWYTEANVDGATVTVGLFNQGTDAVSESDDIGAITSEPGNAGYSRLSSPVTTQVLSTSEYGFATDNSLQFDTQNATDTVDHAFFVVNFQSDTVGGDASATDHLVGIAELSGDLNLSNFNSISFNAGDLGIEIS